MLLLRKEDLSKVVLIKMLLLSTMSSAQIDTRGTDFGNGGDPIREVFNGARVFGQQLIDKTPDHAKKFLSAKSLRIFNEYGGAVLLHIMTVEHRWGRYPDQEDCVKRSLISNRYISLSYGVCRDEVKDAVKATRILLETSFLTAVTAAELDDIKALLDELMNLWKKKLTKSYLRAKNTSQSHVWLVGKWRCENRERNLRFPLRVHAAGLIEAKFRPIAGNRLQIKLSNTAQITASGRAMKAEAIGQLIRAASNRNDNLVLSTECRYPVTTTVEASVEEDSLTMAFQMSGRATNDTCGAIPKLDFSVECSRSKNDD